MSTLTAQLKHRAKAVAAAVLGAVVTYAATAITSGTAVTLHGAEMAAVAAVLTGLGVHQAPRNSASVKKPKRAAKKV